MMDTKRKKELLEAYKNRHPETCRFPITTGGKLFVYCIKHGLSVYSGNL